jgi:glyoxylase-like metal-dependent hydrolase (beta-lactamase superfamily II)
MHRVRVGNVDIIALSDGEGGSPATRVYAAAGDAVERYRQFMDAEGNVPQNFACFLLRADGRTVLVDCGNGPEREGKLLQELDAAGVQPADVDTVIFTHLHGDHTGWNLERESGKPRFANARYLVPRPDWDRGIEQNREGGSFNRDIRPLEALGVLELIEGERTLSESLVTLPTPGHTPGHTSIVVRSDGQEAYIIGDAFITPIDVAEYEWPTSWDADPEQTVRTRRLLLDRIEPRGLLVGASHLPAPSLGHFAMVGGTRTWRGVELGAK